MKTWMWVMGTLTLLAGCSESPVPMEVQGVGGHSNPGAGAAPPPPVAAPASAVTDGGTPPAVTVAPTPGAEATPQPGGEGTAGTDSATAGTGSTVVSAGTGSTVISAGTGSTVISAGTGSTVVTGGGAPTNPAAAGSPAQGNTPGGDPSILNAPYPPKFTQEELSGGGRSIKISGKLICDFCTEGQRINIDGLIQESGKPILVTQLVLTKAGDFEMWVPRNLQSINIGGVLDLNNDGRPASNEPMARANQEPVNLFGKTEIGGLELKMLSREQMTSIPGKP